jgi:phenylacetate-CoA ligase
MSAVPKIRSARTSLAIEQAEQRRWRPRPGKSVGPFEALLPREFRPAEGQRAEELRRLAAILGFAMRQVPYYRDLFSRLGFRPDKMKSLDDLRLLPVLTRSEVQAHGEELTAARLPPREAPGRVRRTSGTTGQPLRVKHTFGSNFMFPLLKQRELRWFRYDPAGTLGAIRPVRDLPRKPDEPVLAKGEVCRFPLWPGVGVVFETGPLVGFGNNNPPQDQTAWLLETRPDYLIAQAGDLEHLALSLGERGREIGLRGIESISHQLTPEMRARIEAAFGVPVHENYGLNEFGLVATRCPEGGRFHIHSELCLVEIIDEQGEPCPPGRAGRVLVTGLANPMMPLFRYDSDDMAEVVEGPCPCGRTLASFGRIYGRYRRIVLMPPGTWERWATVQRALNELPPELGGPLRQYQFHQYRDGRYELRLTFAASMPAGFAERMQRAWAAGAGGDSPLAVREMAEIPRPPGGKFQNFTSDFAPPPGPLTDSSEGA